MVIRYIYTPSVPISVTPYFFVIISVSSNQTKLSLLSFPFFVFLFFFFNYTMKKSLQCLNTLRFLTLLFSFIGLGCHFAQCTLLNIYQKKVSQLITIVICTILNFLSGVDKYTKLVYIWSLASMLNALIFFLR